MVIPSTQGTIEEGGSQLAIVTEASLNADFGLDGNTYTIGGGAVTGPGCRKVFCKSPAVSRRFLKIRCF